VYYIEVEIVYLVKINKAVALQYFNTKPYITATELLLLVGWLINAERSFCANCRKGKPAQSAKDGQLCNTIHITLRYMIRM